jgi:hypothetical protein
MQEQRRSPVPLEPPHLPSPLPASAGLIWLVMTGIRPIAKRPRGLDRPDSRDSDSSASCIDA